MKQNHLDAIKNLDRLLLDDTNSNMADLRAELAASGVDVDAYLARFSSEIRKGFQRQQKAAVLESAKKIANSAQKLFGDLKNQSFVQLKELYDRVRAGDFGPNIREAALARCRNQNGEEPSETELRSWLEDISISAK